MTQIETIRQATQKAHEELDAALLPHLINIHNTNDYIKLLTAFYGFFKPVYDQIDTHLCLSDLPDYSTRRKPADLLKNLEALQHNYTVTHFCTQLPYIHNNASAFGALYVMEGSTLGGLMIKKMIAGQTGLSDEQLCFFAGYGKQTRDRWNVFVAAFNEIIQIKNEEQAALNAATETFACFKIWLAAVYF